MKKKKLVSLLSLGLSATILLAACGNGDEGADTGTDTGTADTSSTETADTSSTDTGEQTDNDFSIAMVTDIGGVDDKSFNQSAWEGMQAWGKENGIEEGIGGYNAIISNSSADLVTNVNTGINNGFDIVFGIGYLLKDTLQDAADNNPDTLFAIIDDTIEGENTTSMLFADNEAAFLAGVAAALTTNTDQIGFVGGISGVVIDRFEAGFVAGVNHVNPDIVVDVQYANSFDDAAIAKSIANGMYSSGVDVIYQAAGNAGNGVFSEARDIVTADPTREVWVVGVDRDQQEEGQVTIDGEVRDLTLASTVKGVGTAVQQIANQAMNGEFPANEVNVLSLADDGVSLTDGILTEEVLAEVRAVEQQIIDGEIEVPEVPADKE